MVCICTIFATIAELTTFFPDEMNVFYLRLYSLLALIGVVLTCVGEFLYFYGFEGTNFQVSLDVISKTETEHIAQGMFCSILGIGLWLFITYPLRVALHKTNFAMRQWIQASLLIYIGCSLVFHVSMGWIGMTDHVASLIAPEQMILSEDIRQQSHELYMVILKFSFFASVLFSGLLVWVIFKGQTHLPKWIILFTPILIFTILKLLPSKFIEIPAPYGGWMDISIGCIGLFILFTIIIRSALRNVSM